MDRWYLRAIDVPEQDDTWPEELDALASDDGNHACYSSDLLGGRWLRDLRKPEPHSLLRDALARHGKAVTGEHGTQPHLAVDGGSAVRGFDRLDSHGYSLAHRVHFAAERPAPNSCVRPRYAVMP